MNGIENKKIAKRGEIQIEENKITRKITCGNPLFKLTCNFLTSIHINGRLSKTRSPSIFNLFVKYIIIRMNKIKGNSSGTLTLVSLNFWSISLHRPCWHFLAQSPGEEVLSPSPAMASEMRGWHFLAPLLRLS
jgi:hypothetical protein